MTIDEFVEKNLKPEEIEKFKDLIKECKAREKKNQESSEASLKGIEEIVKAKMVELVNEVKEAIVDHLLLEFINSNQKIGSA